MNCDNSCCIYCEKVGCIREEITPDVTGSCRECIYAPVEEAVLSEARQRLLTAYKERG